MFEAKAKARVFRGQGQGRPSGLKGQGQGQWSLRPTKKNMFKAQVFYFHYMSTFFSYQNYLNSNEINT